MLSILLGLITGLAGPISSAITTIADLKKAKVQAETDKEKMAYNQQIEEAHDRKAILVAEAGNRIAGVINASIRLTLALGPAAVLLKLFAWDKVVGSFEGCAGLAPTAAKALKEHCMTFRTDPMDVYQWSVISAVIAFYFAYDMFARSRK